MKYMYMYMYMGTGEHINSGENTSKCPTVVYTPAYKTVSWHSVITCTSYTHELLLIIIIL